MESSVDMVPFPPPTLLFGIAFIVDVVLFDDGIVVVDDDVAFMVVADVDCDGDAVSIGSTHSVRPLNTNVPQPLHGSTLTPRNVMAAAVDCRLVMFAPAAC